MWRCTAVANDRRDGWGRESWPALAGFSGAESRSDVTGGGPCVSPSYPSSHGQIVRASKFVSVDSCGRSTSSEYTQIWGTIDGLDARRVSQSAVTTKNGFDID